jgi:uncharacterized protein YqeY
VSLLKTQIQEDMKTAMRAGDRDRLSVVRMLLAAIKQREVDERTETTDANVLQILEKQIKQRRESATQFTAGGRADLADREAAEIAVLQTWLPSALSAGEIDALIDEVMTACAATSMKDMGRVMAALRERAQGRADFSTIGESVKARLSGK